MRFTLLATISAFALHVAAGVAGAQTADESVLTVEPGSTPVVQEAVIEEQRYDQVLSEELIGADVLTLDHGRVGTLDAILFDGEGRIVGGIVAVGGFLGIGSKDVALSWDEFDVRPDEGVVYIDMTQAALEAAPAFKDRDAIEMEQQAERARKDLEMQQQLQLQPSVDDRLLEEQGQTEQTQ